MSSLSSQPGLISERRAIWVMTCLAIALVLSMWLATAIGSSEDYSIQDILRVVCFKLGLTSQPNVAPNTISILWELRLPRVALAILVGSSLAVAGALLQSLFENPMADSFIVGVSPGAALGGVIASSLGLQMSTLGLNSITIFAFAGALATTALVYFLAKRGSKVAVSLLLLTGMAVGGLATAFTTILLMRQDAYTMRNSMSWLFGSLAYRSWDYPIALCPYVIVGLLVALWFWRELNLLSLGEESAHHLGVPLERTKLILLGTAALLAAASVAASGIIGFVGLMVPHIVRKLLGPNHRYLLPGSVLGGALLLLWSDIASRRLMTGEEVPIGVITSILGGLFFLILLARTKSKLA